MAPSLPEDGGRLQAAIGGRASPHRGLIDSTDPIDPTDKVETPPRAFGGFGEIRFRRFRRWSRWGRCPAVIRGRLPPERGLIDSTDPIDPTDKVKLPPASLRRVWGNSISSVESVESVGSMSGRHGGRASPKRGLAAAFSAAAFSAAAFATALSAGPVDAGPRDAIPAGFTDGEEVGKPRRGHAPVFPVAAVGSLKILPEAVASYPVLLWVSWSFRKLPGSRTESCPS